VFGKRSNTVPDPRSAAPPPQPVAPPPEPARAPAAAGGDIGLAPLPSDGLGAPITSPPLAPARG